MDLKEVMKYIQIIRKWWWVTGILFAATVGTMFAVAALSEAQYQATVTVQVSAPPPQEVPLYSQFGRQALRDEIEQTRTGFSEFLLEGDAALSAVDTLPDISIKGRELRDSTTIDNPDNSQLMHISVRATDSDMAAVLANTLVETGLQKYGQLLAQPTVNNRKFIENQLEIAREELKLSEDELTQFQINNKIGSLNSALNSQYNLIGTLRIQSDLAKISGDVTRTQAFEDTIFIRETELQNLIGLSAKYSELSDRVARARDTYSFLLDNSTEAQIKENQILAVSHIQIITSARAPQNPIVAIDSKLIVLGAFASILIGVLLTFLLEYLGVSRAAQDFRTRIEPSQAIAASYDNVG